MPSLTVSAVMIATLSHCSFLVLTSQAQAFELTSSKEMKLGRTTRMMELSFGSAQHCLSFSLTERRIAYLCQLADVTMPDISLCMNHECPLRMDCYRFRAAPDSEWQSYSVFEPFGDPPQCDGFIPIDERLKEVPNDGLR